MRRAGFFTHTGMQGSKKVPSHCPRQVDFLSGQVTFLSYLSDGQEIRQVICHKNHLKSKLRLAQGKPNLRATFPKGKVEFKFYLSHDMCMIALPNKYLRRSGSLLLFTTTHTVIYP